MFIASAVGRGVMSFEGDQRPQLEMGGYKVYVSSVYFDTDTGSFAYRVSSAAGREIPSELGPRPLDELSLDVLGSVERSVRASLEMRRAAGLVRSDDLSRRGKGVVL